MLAKAYAEMMKVKSAEFVFTSRKENGTITRSHLIFDGSKSFLELRVLEKGVLPANHRIDDNTAIFDGASVFQKNGASVRQYSTSVPRGYPSPTQVAFHWLTTGMRIGRDAERLFEWELWGEFASRVVEASEIENGVFRLRAEKLPSTIDYVDVYLDSSKNFYPIKSEFYRNGVCVGSCDCVVQMFQSEDGLNVAFPVSAEYRMFAEQSSNNVWTSHDVEPSTVRINPRISETQFTLAALTTDKAFDVDAMNSRLANELAAPTNELKSKHVPSLRLLSIVSLLAIVLIVGLFFLRKR